MQEHNSLLCICVFSTDGKVLCVLSYGYKEEVEWKGICSSLSQEEYVKEKPGGILGEMQQWTVV